MQFIFLAALMVVVPLARATELRDMKLATLKLKFNNPDYTYEIERMPQGNYIIDAYFTSGPKPRSAWNYWQPPGREEAIELVQARAGEKGRYIEFKCQTETHAAVYIHGQLASETKFDHGYLVFIPHDSSLKGKVFRFRKDAGTGEIQGDRVEIGELTQVALTEAQKNFATELPLLEINLLTKDLSSLRQLSEIHSAPKLLETLLNLHRELIFEYLPETEIAEGRFVPAFDQEHSQAKLLLKKGFSRATAFHEILHYFIDRARLARWPEETVQQKRSYRGWKRAEGLALDGANPNALNRAQLILNLIDGILNESGQEVEVIVYLLQQREALGLCVSELAPQYQNARFEFMQLIEDLAKFADQIEKFKAPQGLAKAQLQKFAQIHNRLARIYRRATELAKILQGPDCAQYLSGRD